MRDLEVLIRAVPVREGLGHGVLGVGDVRLCLLDVRLGLLLPGVEPVHETLERVHLVLQVLHLTLHLDLLGMAVIAEGDVVPAGAPRASCPPR